MRKLIWAACLMTLPSVVLGAPETSPDVWKKCTVTSWQLCDPVSCSTGHIANLSYYLASYKNDDGTSGGYYYRCKAKGGCDIVNDFWISKEPFGYTAWSSRSHSTVTRMGSDGQMTDVITESKFVLISRGPCEDSPPPPIIRQTPRTE